MTATPATLYSGFTASMQPDPEARHNGGEASVSYRTAFPISEARCATTPIELEWVPNREQRIVPEPMMALCRRCPGRASCLAWAIGTDGAGEAGYWAGTTTADRDEMRASDRRDVAEADRIQRTIRTEGALHENGAGSDLWYRKGCTCGECRRAHAAYRRQDRQRTRERSPVAA